MVLPVNLCLEPLEDPCVRKKFEDAFFKSFTRFLPFMLHFARAAFTFIPEIKGFYFFRVQRNLATLLLLSHHFRWKTVPVFLMWIQLPSPKFQNFILMRFVRNLRPPC